MWLITIFLWNNCHLLLQLIFQKRSELRLWYLRQVSTCFIYTSTASFVFIYIFFLLHSLHLKPVSPAFIFIRSTNIRNCHNVCRKVLEVKERQENYNNKKQNNSDDVYFSISWRSAWYIAASDVIVRKHPLPLPSNQSTFLWRAFLTNKIIPSKQIL